MIADQPVTTHSADVRIELELDAQHYAVAQIGPGRLIFDRPVLLPAITGELTLFVDGHARRWRVAIQPAKTPSRTVQAEFSDAD